MLRAVALLLVLALALATAQGRQLLQAAPAAERMMPTTVAGVPQAPQPTRVGVWAAFFPLLFHDPAGNFVGASLGEIGPPQPVQGPPGSAAAAAPSPPLVLDPRPPGGLLPTAGFEAGVRDRITELANLQPTIVSWELVTLQLEVQGGRACAAPPARPTAFASHNRAPPPPPAQVMLNSLDDRQNSLANGALAAQLVPAAAFGRTPGTAAAPAALDGGSPCTCPPAATTPLALSCAPLGADTVDWVIGAFSV